MAEGLPAGAANPDTAQNRRRQRRDLARGTTNRENTTNPEMRIQGQALQETPTSEVGTGLLGRIANFPIDVAKAGGHLAWKATKGTAKFGGRAAVGTVKYPVKYTAMTGGGALLVGGGMAGGALYLAGKGAKLALGPATKWAIHADKKFGEGFDTGWKLTRESIMGIKDKK